MTSNGQAGLDRQNETFWAELCGTGLARQLGITDLNPDSIARFDRAYLDLYPYLHSYVGTRLRGKRTLEIGLGFGTLSGVILSSGADYFGLDISPSPVELVRRRLEWAGIAGGEEKVVQGSVLEIPFPDESFDFCISIGCLHHCGDLPRALDECYRILKPGGEALVMLYHRHSWRQWLARFRGVRHRALAGLYDKNQAGVVAPHTDYVSRSEARRLFKRFSSIKINCHNFDDLCLGGRVIVPRNRLLGRLDTWVGLDLYIEACK